MVKSGSPVIEFRLLQSFLIVAQRRNFSQAAKQLHLSQPALSRQIRALEQSLGCELLRRTPQGAELTSSGERLRREGEDLLARWQELANAVRGAGRRDHTVRLAHFGSLLALFIAPALQRVQRRFGARFDLIETNPSEALRLLAAGECDAVLGPRQRRPRRRMVSQVVADPPAAIVVAAHHPMAKRRTVSLADLHSARWLAWEPQQYPEFYDALRSGCRRSGFAPRIVGFVDSAAALLAGVADGEAVGYTGQLPGLSLPRGYCLVPLQPDELDLALVLSWKTASPHEEALAWLAELIADAVHGPERDRTWAHQQPLATARQRSSGQRRKPA